MLKCSDSLEYLKGIENYGIDMIYADPPYALGSEVIVRKDGKVDYAKASDFMGKWEMPTGDYWSNWFSEAFRTLKHGGYCVMFGMDRQLLLFKYYANLAGFVEQQSLYWYFISNFPKATDLSKMIDKSLGEEREVVRVRENDVRPNMEINSKKESNPYQLGLKASGSGVDTKSTSELGKKYDGYKYSISPLKQTCETIMVFKKPTKTGSVLHDCLAYENGDKNITVSALNIDGNRVGISGGGTHCDNRDENGKCLGHNNAGKTTSGETVHADESDGGRYPSQTFIDEQVADVLDRQSGVSKSQGGGKKEGIVYGEIYGRKSNVEIGDEGYFGDIGGCSKILHKCKYEQEDYDLFKYEPKVSGGERNAGLNGFDNNIPMYEQYHRQNAQNTKGIETPYAGSGRGGGDLRNNHPTLKPISLNEHILKLFKTPNDQKICYPFAGAGSEIIGGIKAGFDNWCGCELNQEYVDIALARIKYWKEEMTTQTDIFDFLD